MFISVSINRDVLIERLEIIDIKPWHYEDYNIVRVKNHVGLKSEFVLPKNNYNIGDKLVLTLEKHEQPTEVSFGVCDDLRALT